MADQDVRAIVMEVLSDPLNLPDVFWGYSIQRWIADAPVLPLSQVFGFRQFVAKLSYLGDFTQASWPPPGTPSSRDVALLSDTYGGLTFQWALEYRPDLNMSDPWRPVDGLTPSSAVFVSQSSTGTNAGTTTQLGSFTIPIAGIWQLDTDATAYGINSNQVVQVTTYLGTTAGASDIASLAGSGAAPSFVADHAHQFTFTKGEVVYVGAHNSGSNFMGANETVIRVRPLALANA